MNHRGYAVSWLCGGLAPFAGAFRAVAQISARRGWSPHGRPLGRAIFAGLSHRAQDKDHAS
jgi:hypothetical protein